MSRSFVSNRSKHIESSRQLSLSDILVSDEEGGFPNGTQNRKNIHKSLYELRNFVKEKDIGNKINTERKIKPDLDKSGSVDEKMNALKTETHTRQMSFSVRNYASTSRI